MANEDKPKKDYSVALKALRNPPTGPVKYPMMVRFVFPCKRCGKSHPIESGLSVRIAYSDEQAHQMLAAFAQTVEPRIFTCSCGHEDEYFQNDVAGHPLESA